MAAENSMAPFATTTVSDTPPDINEMLAAKSSLTPNDRLVLYLDDQGSPRIYVITNETKALKYSELTPVHTFSSELNSASATTLADVYSYVRKHYPADEYGLICWSHGTGWIPSTYPTDPGCLQHNTSSLEESVAPRRSFAIDNEKNSVNNTGHQMNIQDMAAALKDAPPFDFILFDACLMQCVEVAYELRHCTHYIIASPAEIPGPGAPYHDILPIVFDDSKSSVEIADVYFKYYSNSSYGSVLSVVDCTQMDAFAQYMRGVISKYRECLLSMSYDNILNYFPPYDNYSSNGLGVTDFYDIRGLMLRLLPEEEYAEWNEWCNRLLVKQLYASFWYSNLPYSSYGGRTYLVDEIQCSGMSMFVPLSKYDADTWNYNAAYLETAWGKDVWKE
jgi:hypothetical protein